MKAKAIKQAWFEVKNSRRYLGLYKAQAPSQAIAKALADHAIPNDDFYADPAPKWLVELFHGASSSRNSKAFIEGLMR